MSTTTPEQNTPSNQILRAKIIWGALLFSQVIYGFLAFTTAQGYTPSEGETLTPFHQNILFKPLAFFALVTFVLSFVIPKFIFKTTNPQSKNENTNFSITPYFTPCILLLALLESVALCGFVISFMTHDFQAYPSFAVFSVIGFLASFPNQENLLKIAGDFSTSLGSSTKVIQ